MEAEVYFDGRRLRNLVRGQKTEKKIAPALASSAIARVVEGVYLTWV
jgi:hypothetical protein